MAKILEDASDLAFVYATFPDRALAKTIGHAAVEKRLAACANVFTEHESIYRWQNKIETARECVAIFKTVDGQTEHLAEFIRSHHPYDTPYIAVLTPTQMNSKFAAWLRDSCGG